MEFRCTTCGELHALNELAFGAEAPLQWEMIPEEERSGSQLGEEQCVIEGRLGNGYYLRGRLEIPIRGSGGTFTWGVWCSLSESSFLEIAAHWDDPRRVQMGPYFGWLSTSLPGYPDTFLLKTNVHQQLPGIRPLVELEPTEHPLAVEQREGIAPERLQALVSSLLHSGS